MELRQEIRSRRLIFDGGTGSLLQENGLKAGEFPEIWNITHPEVCKRIHLDYLKAGADLITSNTFGANGLKFKGEPWAGISERPAASYTVEEIVAAAMENARAAVKESRLQHRGPPRAPMRSRALPVMELARPQLSAASGVAPVAMLTKMPVDTAAPQQPQRYTFTELFRACNLPASASSLFTEPRARAEISVQNGRICIDLCLTEYYEYRIKRRVNGEERLLADGFCESRVIDKDVCAGQRYTYTVTNDPRCAQGVQANLYVCEGEPVAGDIFCPGADGFQDTLVYPETDT